ncbi:hypothetical protein J4573_19670 [Actinomadura barringtoniae]|uniref:Carboxypeptidase regulatory-like domain-containing protein n=1 Tax=Actinomadura barringtoniae TaxID=1427535 RepID=A0A939PHK5_9ACTN|nr:hypothetical protein [Actinomadura barringtoniae]MBO2449329.1 hypothetical protein [Actinomadura barringtoniae]
MRRFLAALASLVVVLAVLQPGRALAGPAADLQVVQVTAVTANGNFMSYYERPFGAKASVTHDLPIKRVQARLYKAGTNDLVSTSDKLTARSVDDRRAVYTTDELWDPPVGDYEIVVTAWDEGGDQHEGRSGLVRKRLPTQLAEVTQDRTKVDDEHDTVTITGRLVHLDAGGEAQPLVGVRVYEYNGGVGLSAQTDADGRFSLVWRTTETGQLRLTSDPTGPYAPATMKTISVTRPRYATRITVSDTPAQRVGDRVVLTGLLERQDDTGWRGLANAQVAINFLQMAGMVTSRRVMTVETRADGRFTAEVAALGAGWWQANFGPAGDYEAAYANTDRRNLLYTTVINGFDAGPEPIMAGSKMTARGQVLRSGATGPQAVVAGAPIALQFSPDGKTWRDVVQSTSGPHGWFTFTLSASASTDGQWRAVYRGGGSGNASPYTDDAPSVSPADYVKVRFYTRIASFNASPEPVRKGRTLAVQGRLERLVGTWKPGSGATVDVYFKAKDSARWARVAVVKTGASGWFLWKFKASKDGTWLATYAGSSTYRGASSVGDYVDVR